MYIIDRQLKTKKSVENIEIPIPDEHNKKIEVENELLSDIKVFHVCKVVHV